MKADKGELMNEENKCISSFGRIRDTRDVSSFVKEAIAHLIAFARRQKSKTCYHGCFWGATVAPFEMAYDGERIVGFPPYDGV